MSIVRQYTDKRIISSNFKHSILTLHFYSNDEKYLKKTLHSIEWSYV